MAALIRRVVEVVKGCGGSAVVEYDVGAKKLVVCRTEVGKMLPEDLYAKWEDGNEFGAEHNTELEVGSGSAAEGAQTKKEGKSTVSAPGDTKGKKAATPAKQDAEDLTQNPTPTREG